MGILRADVVSHSKLQPTGSVAFDGTTDYLTIPASGAWLSGVANSTAKKSFTVEWWQYWNAVSGYVDLLDVNYTSGLLLEAANGKYTVYAGGGSQGVEATAAVTGQWYHYALVFYSGTPLAPGSIVLYRDGEVSASGNVAGNVQVGNSSTVLSIGAKQSNGAYSLNGYISNFRWCDRVVYNAPFTPPKFELTAIAGTQLLCCQSSSSVTEAAVIPGGLSITANGNAAASAFAPDIKKDNTDIGPVFEDNTKFDTLSYMVPPGGTTEQSNRGRGVYGGGIEAPSPSTAEIQYIQIQSQGNAVDFGSLTVARTAVGGSGNSTRGIFSGGTPNNTEIDYVTISTTAKAVDFGDMTVGRGVGNGCASSSTRGIAGWGGSTGSNSDVIDYITIASTGNATDFGDTVGTNRRNTGQASSPTRGVRGGGYTTGGVNNIDYITIATTGNSQDFGDLTAARYGCGAASNNTRCVWGGGGPSAVNTMDYVTIASTGNATDYGDLTSTRIANSALSNSIRGVWAGGYTPTFVNTMDYVTIVNTGNASDFGDAVNKHRNMGATTDSHGGLS